MGESKYAIGTRDAIAAANDLREEILDVDEWQVALRIRGLTLAERNVMIEKATRDNGAVDTLRATIWAFIQGVVEPRFSAADYDMLRGKSAVVERIAMRIMALSGIGKDAFNQALKNSSPTPSDGSSLN